MTFLRRINSNPFLVVAKPRDDVRDDLPGAPKKRTRKGAPQRGGQKTPPPEKQASPSDDKVTPPDTIVEQDTGAPPPLPEVKESDKVQFQQHQTHDGDGEDGDDGEEEESDDGVQIGRSNLRENRLTELSTMKPVLFIFAAKAQALAPFFKKIEQIVTNPKMCEKLVGKPLKKGADGVSSGYAYIVHEQVSSFLQKKAEDSSIPFYTQSFMDKIKEPKPFSDLKLGDALTKQLVDPSSFEKLLDNAYKKLVKASQVEHSGSTNVVQIASSIPINYLRFLSTVRKPRIVYPGYTLGGYARDDMNYAECSQQEYNNLITEMNKFKQLNKFFKDIGFVTISPEVDGKEFKMANCIILKSADKFDLHRELTVAEKKVKWLDYLNYYATHVLDKGAKKTGSFVPGKLVQGTLVTHFNRDLTQCIVWGSVGQPLHINEQEIKNIFGISDIDTRYSG